MTRSSLVLTLALAATGFAFAGSAEAAKTRDPACRSTKWTVSVPQGARDGEAVIIDAPENHVWRVAAGGVPNNAMLIVEYRSTVGTTGEIVLGSGEAELVQGARVTMRLQRQGGGTPGIAVAGTYNMKCGK